MANLFYDNANVNDLFYQDYAGVLGYTRTAFILESLEWFCSNLDTESTIYADRIKRKEAELLYRKGLISDFQILMIRTYVPFIGLTSDYWREVRRISACA